VDRKALLGKDAISPGRGIQSAITATSKFLILLVVRRSYRALMSEF
jgi:hypothetical protein